MTKILVPFGMACVQCYKCATPIVMHEQTLIDLKESHREFFCVWGHPQVFSKDRGIAGRLADAERERDRLKQNKVYLEERLQSANQRADHSERSARAYKGVATKMKKRAVAGVCPCCNRHFRELERHMASKHPDYTKAPLVRRDDELLQ